MVYVNIFRISGSQVWKVGCSYRSLAELHINILVLADMKTQAQSVELIHPQHCRKSKFTRSLLSL